MTFQPIYDRILVRCLNGHAQTSSNPDHARATNSQLQEGQVIRVGGGYPRGDGYLRPLTVKAGDRVLIETTSSIELDVEGEALLVIKESDIVGIIGSQRASRTRHRPLPARNGESLDHHWA